MDSDTKIKSIVEEIRAIKREILLVEDDKYDREIALRAFDCLLNKFSIDTASNGHEAIQLLIRQTYNVVFLDMKMPVKDGVEVLEYCQKNCPKTPVIIVTGYRGDAIFDKVPMLSFKLIIDKPLTEKIVIRALQQINLLA